MVQLKQPNHYSGPKDFLVLWSFDKFSYNVTALTDSCLAILHEEIYQNPEKYPACAKVIKAGYKLDLQMGISKMFNARKRINDLEDAYEIKYDEIVKPFSEFSWRERFHILRNGTVLIDKNEPWNQEKADELIEALDSLEIEMCEEICGIMVQEALRDCPNVEQVAEEVLLALDNLQLMLDDDDDDDDDDEQ